MVYKNMSNWPISVISGWKLSEGHSILPEANSGMFWLISARMERNWQLWLGPMNKTLQQKYYRKFCVLYMINFMVGSSPMRVKLGEDPFRGIYFEQSGFLIGKNLICMLGNFLWVQSLCNNFSLYLTDKCPIDPSPANPYISYIELKPFKETLTNFLRLLLQLYFPTKANKTPNCD